MQRPCNPRCAVALQCCSHADCMKSNYTNGVAAYEHHIRQKAGLQHCSPTWCRYREGRPVSPGCSWASPPSCWLWQSSACSASLLTPPCLLARYPLLCTVCLHSILWLSLPWQLCLYCACLHSAAVANCAAHMVSVPASRFVEASLQHMRLHSLTQHARFLVAQYTRGLCSSSYCLQAILTTHMRLVLRIC